MQNIQITCPTDTNIEPNVGMNLIENAYAGEKHHMRFKSNPNDMIPNLQGSEPADEISNTLSSKNAKKTDGKHNAAEHCIYYQNKFFLNALKKS